MWLSVRAGNGSLAAAVGLPQHPRAAVVAKAFTKSRDLLRAVFAVLPHPKGPPPLPPPSLRSRFILAMTVMLVPLALLTGVAHLSLQRATAALDEVTEEATQEMHHLMVLQAAVLQLDEELNDYLQGRPDGRQSVIDASSRADKAVDDVLAAPFE